MPFVSSCTIFHTHNCKPTFSHHVHHNSDLALSHKHTCTQECVWKIQFLPLAEMIEIKTQTLYHFIPVFFSMHLKMWVLSSVSTGKCARKCVFLREIHRYRRSSHLITVPASFSHSSDWYVLASPLEWNPEPSGDFHASAELTELSGLPYGF